MEYDLCILGGGPAGEAAAVAAAQGGFSVLLCEEHALGGTCLNEGCIPTKTFLHSAHLRQKALAGAEFGVSGTGDATLDHLSVLRRRDRVVRVLTAGVRAELKNQAIDIRSGHGEICGKENGLFCLQTEEGEVTAKRLLIATGSLPFIPPIAGLEDAMQSGFACTSTELLHLDIRPDSLVILGAGVIGLEFADYFDALGVPVTILELTEGILPGADRDLCHEVEKTLSKRGVRFLFGARVTKIGDHSVTYEVNGAPFTVPAARFLCAAGRRARTQGFGLETLGIPTNQPLKTDANGKTGVENLWAAGDVNGVSMLAHTAAREARSAVCDMLGTPEPVDYRKIPAVLYTAPEAAMIGYTVSDALDEGMDAYEKSATLRQSGRFVAETAGENGLCKIVLERGSERILGAHLCGEYASELISIFSLALSENLCARDMLRAVFPHPSVGEVIRSVLS